MRVIAALGAFVVALSAGACAAPAALADDLPTCAAAGAYSAARNGVSVLVLRNGEVVCEAYANGAGAADAHELWSGTKSFNGVMAAIAVRDGLLTLDEPVSDTLTEWRGDPQRARVTIRQLLSLTSGVRGGSGRAPDYAEAVETPLTAAPGAAFQYGGAPFQIFGALMSRKLAAAGRDPDPLAYLRERLLDPLGMDSSRWRRTLAGDAILPQGSVFTARDWARFGEFVRLGGRIDGVEIVDRETFDALFVGSEANPGYGVSWWLPRANSVPGVSTASTDIGLRPEGLPRDMVMAAGAGDQRLYVIPSLGLTIVRQADLSPERAMQAIREGRRRRDGPRWSDVDFIGIVTGQ